MKKRVFIAAVLLICAAIVVGVLATNRAPSSDETVITSLTNLKTANSTATTGNKLNFNWLTGNADQQSTFDTSKPALLYDFSVSDTASDFKNGNQTIHVEKEGYYSFRIDGSDPYVWLSQPGVKCSDAQYALIKYRTTCQAQGEFFVQRSDGVEMGHICYRNSHFQSTVQANTRFPNIL